MLAAPTTQKVFETKCVKGAKRDFKDAPASFLLVNAHWHGIIGAVTQAVLDLIVGGFFNI